MTTQFESFTWQFVKWCNPERHVVPTAKLLMWHPSCCPKQRVMLKMSP